MPCQPCSPPSLRPAAAYGTARIARALPSPCAACARTRQSTSGTAEHTLKHVAGGTFRTSQEEQLAPPDSQSQAQPCRSAPSSRSPRLGVIRAARAESSSGGGARCGGGRAQLETAPPQPLLESCRAWPLPATLADRGGSSASAPLSGAPFSPQPAAAAQRARDEPPMGPGGPRRHQIDSRTTEKWGV